MGAWGAGSFENDTALDWAGDVSEGGDVTVVITALIRVREERRSERVATQGLAAAEIVAFWLGHPDSQFPDYLRDWADRNSGAFSPESVTLAREAVSIVKTKSGLKDLWEEGNGNSASEWHAAIADLERRLQTT